MRFIRLVLLPFAVVGTIEAAECRFSQKLDFSVPAGDLRHLSLNTAAGRLTVVGRAGLDAIEVDATACASSQKRLDNQRLEHRRNGDDLEIVADERNGWNWSGNAYGYIDLVINVPRGMFVTIDDGSGDVIVSDVAGLTVDDGSGQLEITDIAGDVDIRDGSGPLVVEHVGGSVVIRDGSGSLKVAHVTRDVLIDDDGSGDIEIADVTHNVNIRDDGSGSIRVERIGGDVFVGEDGAGMIRVRDVAGDFLVGDDANGGIDYANVGGQVQVPEKRRGKRQDFGLK